MIDKFDLTLEIDRLANEIPEGYTGTNFDFNRGYVKALLDVLYV